MRVLAAAEAAKLSWALRWLALLAQAEKATPRPPPGRQEEPGSSAEARVNGDLVIPGADLGRVLQQAILSRAGKLGPSSRD